MNIRKSLLLSVVAVTLAAPGLSFATSMWQPVITDHGEVFAPINSTSTKTRAEVIDELQSAKRDGSFLSDWAFERGLTAPVKTTESKLTRVEVQKELFSQSAEDKKLMQELYGHS
jgi:hypothetical protein